jgi:spore coat protein U-like protein
MKRSALKNISVTGCSFVCGAALLFAPATVSAATATATMAISATVVASCTVTATAMTFGSYTSAAATAATATVTPICSNTTPYTIGLSAGTSTGATVTARAMFVTGTPAVLLTYGLFSDAGHTVNYATSGSITGSGAAQPVTIYGNIPAGQTIAPGAYQDTITATITY